MCTADACFPPCLSIAVLAAALCLQLQRTAGRSRTAARDATHGNRREGTHNSHLLLPQQMKAQKDHSPLSCQWTLARRCRATLSRVDANACCSQSGGRVLQRALSAYLQSKSKVLVRWLNSQPDVQLANYRQSVHWSELFVRRLIEFTVYAARGFTLIGLS